METHLAKIATSAVEFLAHHPSESYGAVTEGLFGYLRAEYGETERVKSCEKGAVDAWIEPTDLQDSGPAGKGTAAAYSALSCISEVLSP